MTESMKPPSIVAGVARRIHKKLQAGGKAQLDGYDWSIGDQLMRDFSENADVLMWLEEYIRIYGMTDLGEAGAFFSDTGLYDEVCELLTDLRLVIRVRRDMRDYKPQDLRAYSAKLALRRMLGKWRERIEIPRGAQVYDIEQALIQYAFSRRIVPQIIAFATRLQETAADVGQQLNASGEVMRFKQPGDKH